MVLNGAVSLLERSSNQWNFGFPLSNSIFFENVGHSKEVISISVEFTMYGIVIEDEPRMHKSIVFQNTPRDKQTDPG